MDTNNNCPKKFSCNLCNYFTSNKKDWNKHIVTIKHTKQITPNINSPKNPLSICECKCGKVYKHKSSLSLHKKTCVGKKDMSELSDKELIIMLLKQNSELILKMGTNHTNSNNTNTNSNNNNNNKTFNLQIFLNEDCKDALNISEFISSIKMDLDDLETTGKLGYVEGVTRIINKNLNELDQTMRPIHCSDMKREVLYIKNDDQWIKENGSKPVLTKAIKQVAHENIRQISEWRKKHPDCTDPDSKKNDLYLNIVSNAMSGITSEEQVKNYEKIISNVAKEVTIDKA
jgi:hypothetical protein